MRILFSPVGKSDWNGVDPQDEGSLTHIVRHQKPDMVVLYLSRELIEKNQADPIEAYLKLISPDVRIVYELREDLVDVHNFDTFYPEFSGIIKRIFTECPDADLLLNVSSGTPAMKSALLTLASFSEHAIKAIQVVDPRYAPGQNNRTSIVGWPNLTDVILKGNIAKLIKRYEYNAASQLAEQMVSIDEEALRLIKGSAVRLDQNLQDAANYFVGTEFPVDRARALPEYLSMLEVRVAKGEWTDYCRSLTPAITETLIDLLEENGIACEAYSMVENNGKRCLDLNQIWESSVLKGAIPNLDFDKNERPILFNWHLYKLVSSLVEDETIKGKVADIRSFEDSVRNRAAHQIVRSDEATIRGLAQLTKKKGKSNYKSTDFALSTLLELTGTAPNLYERINAAILDKL